MKIAELPPGERPRERCLRQGIAALSAVELLTLIIGEGGRAGTALALAHSLLARFGSLAALSELSAVDLTALPGLGPARSSALVAAFELGRRARRELPASMRAVEAPLAAAQILWPLLEGRGQEGVAVLYLGARHQVLGAKLVALGGLNAAGIEAREVYRGAVAANAAAIVLAHNHPSGEPSPSEDDLRLTRRLAACGETLGIKLLDHLVLGHESYVSLRERGVL